MDVDDLRTVRAVVEHGTFSAAAASLRVAQPALSRRVARLERELGGALFDRLPRHAAPTALGLAVAASAQRVIGELDRVLEDSAGIARGVAGKIRMSSLAGGIPALARGITTFQDEHPGVELEVRALDAEAAVRALREREVDLATLPGSATEAGMKRRKLARWRVMLAVRPDHRFARARSVTMSDLGAEPVLMLAPEFMVTKHVTSLAQRTGIRLNVRLRDATPEAVLALARRGWGVAVVPDAIRVPAELVTIPLARAGNTADFDYVVAWLDDRTLSPAAHALIDTLARETARFRS